MAQLALLDQPSAFWRNLSASSALATRGNESDTQRRSDLSQSHSTKGETTNPSNCLTRE